MSSADTPLAPTAQGSGRATLFVFGGTLFLSATLLFAVQPMFAKMVLPKLGGAPGVWSVALVFFQGVLLAGYAYAHLLIRYFGPRMGAFVHLGVLALGALMLPLALAEGWGRPPDQGQILYLLGLFGVSVGLPFFALSANAPLLQAWFARSGAKGSDDPYFLYGASNLGSFIALLGYPVVMEPTLRLGTQSLIWSAGYAVLAMLIAVLSFRTSQGGTTRASAVAATSPKVPARKKLEWVFLAFVPSALLVAVTAHISTDVAAAPFLWVMPLALFLLTFVLVFRERPLIGMDVLTALLPGLIFLVTADWLLRPLMPMVPALILHLVTFFMAAMTAHTRLYAARPPADRLTEFYLWMSFGGVLGGAFAGLLAPHLFPTILEYPILLVLALAVLVRPAALSRGQIGFAALVLVLALAGAAFALAYNFTVDVAESSQWVVAIVVMTSLALVTARSWPLVAVSLLAFSFLVGGLFSPRSSQVLLTRSFFGVHKVLDDRDGLHRLLYHGTTLHGAAEMAGGQLAPGWPEPLTYYSVDGPMGQAIRAAREANGGFKLSPVGIVGLGSGSLACHREEGENWHFYEIDSKVVKIARDSGLFKFVPACAPDAKIHIGDARITLREETFKHELLLIDAFSSDAIPIHLLTREAVQLYFDRLTPNGVLVVHISNRHLDLLPVVGAIARDLGLKALYKQGTVTPEETNRMIARSLVVVLARNDQAFGALPSIDDWETMDETPVRAWTDDYSDILGAILRKLQM